ncbi:hypothetical protein K7432_002574 [Basidiobolus ranarum]
MILHDPLLNPKRDEKSHTKTTPRLSQLMDEIPDTIRKAKTDARQTIDDVHPSSNQARIPGIVAKLQDDVDTATQTGHELDKLKQIAEGLTRQLNSIPPSTVNNSRQLEAYVKRCMLLEEQLKEAKDTIHELESLRSNYVNSDQENLEMRKKLIDKMSEIDEFMSEKLQLLEEKSNLEETVESLTLENEGLRQQVNSKESLLSEKHEKLLLLSETTAQRDQLLEENRNFQEQIKLMSSRNDTLDQELNSIKVALSNSENLVTTLLMNKQKLEESVSQLREEIQESTQSAELLRKKLSEIETSHRIERDHWLNEERGHVDQTKVLQRRYSEISQQMSSYENMKIHLHEWSSRREAASQSPLNSKLAHRSSLESVGLSDGPRIISQLTLLRPSASTPSSPSRTHPPLSPSLSVSRFHF